MVWLVESKVAIRTGQSPDYSEEVKDIMALENLTLEELKKQRPDLVAALKQEITGKKELNDLSGPWNPNLTFDDMSKEFLMKLMNIWQHAWITLSGMWYDEVRAKWGFDAANACELASWEKMGKKVNPRYGKLGNVKMDKDGYPATVLECMKCLQMPLDNIMRGKNAGLFDGQFDDHKREQGPCGIQPVHCPRGAGEELAREDPASVPRAGEEDDRGVRAQPEVRGGAGQVPSAEGPERDCLRVVLPAEGLAAF